MTTRDDIQMYEMVENMSNPKIHRMGECATACIAHPLSPLAVLRIAAIARYYGSSRLARDKMECTLQAVQLRIPG